MDQDTIKNQYCASVLNTIRTRSFLRSAIHNINHSIVVASICLLAISNADAQWRITPAAGAGVQYDDNANLSTGSSLDDSVWGSLLEAQVNFNYASQLTEFGMTPRILARRYDEHSELDSDEWFVNLNYTHTGQRSRFRLRGLFGDESIRTAERSDVDFDVDDPSDIPDDQSGRVLETENRQRLQISPDWSFRTSQRSSIRLGANYLDVTYDNNSNVFLGDFSESRALAAVDFDLSPLNSMSLTGYYRENEFERTSSKPAGYGATLTFVRSPIEKSRFVLALGLDSTEDIAGNDQTNPIGEISFTRWLETSRLLAAFRRTVSGTGSGVMSVRDSINLSLTRNFSERFSVSGGVHVYQTTALDETVVNFEERDYLQFRVLFSYRITQVFSVDFDYRYTYLDRELSTTSSHSNVGTVWLRYQPNKET